MPSLKRCYSWEAAVSYTQWGRTGIRNMGGLGKKLRITSATFWIGCLAIAGIFPLSGFFSKDAILLRAYEVSPVLYSVALFAACSPHFICSVCCSSPFRKFRVRMTRSITCMKARRL
ncbi:MAG: proton-conducting transporter membrane subunit [Bacteroidota bacterium]